MIKQWSVAVLVVVLLGQGTAFAQGTRTPPRLPDIWQYRDPEACRIAYLLLGPDEARPPYSVTACQVIEKPDEPMRSRGLAIAGVLTIAVGVTMIAGQGKTYHVLGDDYCVTDYSLDAGSCYSPGMATYGAVAVGAGALMTWIGMQKVQVRPSITAQRKMVSVGVTW